MKRSGTGSKKKCSKRVKMDNRSVTEEKKNLRKPRDSKFRKILPASSLLPSPCLLKTQNRRKRFWTARKCGLHRKTFLLCFSVVRQTEFIFAKNPAFARLTSSTPGCSTDRSRGRGSHRRLWQAGTGIRRFPERSAFRPLCRRPVRFPGRRGISSRNWRR